MDNFYTTTFAEMGKRLADAKDRYIIEFFGSEALAREHIHLYVFEETPIDLESKTRDLFNDTDLTIRFTTTFRLRLKTEEELKRIAQSYGDEPPSQDLQGL